MHGLIPLSQIRTSLARMKTVDEAKDLRDKAQAVQAYYKQAGDSLEIQNDAAEIRIRAERRIGELIPEIAPHGGDRKSRMHGETLKLSELGISKKQSHRWQKLARLDTKAFDSHIASTRESGKELTTSALLKLSARQPARTAYESSATDPNIITDLALLAGQEFGTVYADPPWKYGNQGTRASTDNHASRMRLSAC